MAKEKEHAKNKKDRIEPPDNPDFSIELTEDIPLRKILKEGLKQASDKNKEKMPMLYCRPMWMEEGIVCLWARDLNRFLAEKCEELSREFMRTLDELETYLKKEEGDKNSP